MHFSIALGVLLAVSNASAGETAAAKTGQGNSAFSGYAIVIPEDAIAPERTAADELSHYIDAVTGLALEVCVEGEAPEKIGAAAKRIDVGPTKAFGTAFPDLDLDALGHDGIVLKTVGDTIYLAGGRPRGTLYAVYTFIEDHLGVRWWSPSESYVPRNPKIKLPQLDTSHVPKLRYREAFYRGAFDGVFAARCKCNGHFEKIPPEYGGHYNILGWCHTFNQILPPARYFKKHPEWYSEIDGQRVRERSQLCLTNDAMRAEFVKNTLEWLRKDPEAGIISISQNDWHGQCQCEKCRALEQQEGSPSGPIIHFVNAVAEAIEPEFPDVLIETLAYSYTRHAPKEARPRKNVVIRLCSIECSYSQPLATGPQNETFKNDIEAWSAIAPQLYIWNYVTNFANYLLPHPNLRVLAPNIRFFIEHNAVALFEQGDSGSSCSDFPKLRAWLLAHLMWDPSRDEKALIAEFLEGYYGPAAGPLQEYIDLIHDAAEQSGVYLRCYMADTSSWLGLGDLNQATQLFDEAAKRTADDAVLDSRVLRARMPLDHVWLNRYHALKRIADAQEERFLGPEDPMAFCDQFIKRAHDFHVGSYREGHPFEEYEPRLRARFRPPAPAPALCKDLPKEKWVDIQDNEFSLHGYPNWATTVEDAKASDGMAARMPANHHQWAVQYPVSADVAALGPVRCYAVVRCEAKADSGGAFQVGIYDSNAPKEVARKVVGIEEAAGREYRVYDLGVHALAWGMYFWIAPMNNPEQVDALFVDRIFCVREK